ncbi:hypothetical protein KGF56_004526 [Candida oxycetoniae]|uniref:Bacteriophage T5 Orf172 DNA-binding domain-containing protein n=1 Tax=Candida oxycetoniae TaxID=497107 RepID=A0AAI9STB1_9ASCO|nr:uncharacterized protein KGF56_004526 [Candida oxycetoniae]KAI3402645.2 hypothetical protein KGF56_004526 [Candida oxycetoniae]
MVAHVYQCYGTTKRGFRCKITVNCDKGYCHYHIDQNKKLAKNLSVSASASTIAQNKKFSSNSYHEAIQLQGPGAFLPKGLPYMEGKVLKSSRKGYIYIYTMKNFINPPKDWNFQIKNIPKTSKRHHDKWINFKSTKSPYILVKIGMTNQLPNIRIKQWESKCKHELINIGPRNEHLLKRRLHWWQQMMYLSLHDTHQDEDRYRYQRFKNDGFYCEENLEAVESMIHSTLREKYGKGDVYCSGCVADEDLTVNKDLEKAPLQNNYKVHTEWFLIPKISIRAIYQMIDEMCRTVGSR